MWSLCHAFCAMPVFSLPANITGIQALTPGFSHVEIKPRLWDLSWADASVPMRKGIVIASILLNGEKVGRSGALKFRPLYGGSTWE